MSFTLVIIIVTALVSFAAFNNDDLRNKLILWPRRMDNPAEYYRFITSGFIHSDMTHLFFNMFTLYFFGRNAEYWFNVIGRPALYPLLYLVTIVAASIPSYLKHKNNPYYSALGASGGVSAILFCTVYIAPWTTIYVWFIPIPAIIAGVLYLVYSAYMAKQERDNIGHDAHFWGAVFGFVFTFIFDPTHGRFFLEQLMQPQFNF